MKGMGYFLCGIGFCMAFTNLYYQFVLNQLAPFPPYSIFITTIGLVLIFTNGGERIE